MTTTGRDRIDGRLRRALAPTAVGRPSSDLFDRVVESVENDRLRRRTARLVVVAAAVVAVVAVVAVATLTPRENGRLLMPWWILELAVVVLLVGLALWLGPFIKRFGRAYAADVFHDNPQTGKSYIVLTDIVYYLIFTAYILGTTSVDARTWGSPRGLVTPDQVTSELGRIAGILVVIGVLHGANIVLMPVLGRLFSLNRRISEPPR